MQLFKNYKALCHHTEEQQNAAYKVATFNLWPLGRGVYLCTDGSCIPNHHKAVMYQIELDGMLEQMQGYKTCTPREFDLYYHFPMNQELVT